MAVLIVLRLNVLFLRNEDNWHFLHTIGVCDAIVLFEMNALVNIVQYRVYIV